MSPPIFVTLCSVFGGQYRTSPLVTKSVGPPLISIFPLPSKTTINSSYFSVLCFPTEARYAFSYQYFLCVIYIENLLSICLHFEFVLLNCQGRLTSAFFPFRNPSHQWRKPAKVGDDGFERSIKLRFRHKPEPAGGQQSNGNNKDDSQA